MRGEEKKGQPTTKKALAENDTSICGKKTNNNCDGNGGKRKRDKNYLLTQHTKCEGGKLGNEESKRENCPALRCVSASKGERGATRALSGLAIHCTVRE